MVWEPGRWVGFPVLLGKAAAGVGVAVGEEQSLVQNLMDQDCLLGAGVFGASNYRIEKSRCGMFHRGFPLETPGSRACEMQRACLRGGAGRRGRVGTKMFSLLARSALQSRLAFRKRLGALGTASSVVEREPFSSERQETQSR